MILFFPILLAISLSFILQKLCKFSLATKAKRQKNTVLTTPCFSFVLLLYLRVYVNPFPFLSLPFSHLLRSISFNLVSLFVFFFSSLFFFLSFFLSPLLFLYFHSYTLSTIAIAT